jgi:hypothetical protein
MEVLEPAAKHELIFVLESWEKQRVPEESRDRKYSNILQLAAALTVTAVTPQVGCYSEQSEESLGPRRWFGRHQRVGQPLKCF